MTHFIFLVALVFTIPYFNKKCPFYIFTFIILFLFLTLRYDYGNDYMSYFNIYKSINAGLSAWGQNDVLFTHLNLLMPNFYLFIGIISLFYILTIYFLIKTNFTVENYWFGILLLLINPYLFLVHLSSIRQTIAICFFIFAVTFAVKKRPIMYCALVFVAMGFHSSAIILLPLYYVLNDTKIEKSKIFVMCLAILFFLITPLFETVMNFILDLEFIPVHYKYYYGLGDKNSLKATLISSFFFFLIIFNINKLKQEEIIYGKLSLLSTIISLLAYKVSMITRIGMYFDIFLIITLPQILNVIQTKVYKQILYILIILIYLLKYIAFFNNPIWSDSYGIYKSILFKQ